MNTAAFPIPLGADQILLRGSQLKNTGWIYGIVIYSGQETKLMMVRLRSSSHLSPSRSQFQNSSSIPLKRTNVEQVTNKQVNTKSLPLQIYSSSFFQKILFLLLLLIILCLFSTIAGEVWTVKNKDKHWYLGLNLGQHSTSNCQALKERFLSFSISSIRTSWLYIFNIFHPFQ